MNGRTMRRIAAFTLITGCIVGASPAMALSASNTFVAVWTENNGGVMNVKDNEASEIEPVKGEYYRVAHPNDRLTLWNKKHGLGEYYEDNDGDAWTVESGNYSRIFKLQGCQYLPVYPDKCTGWKSE